jgi:hypothetical protein
MNFGTLEETVNAFPASNASIWKNRDFNKM